MAKREILAGATDQTIDVFIRDSSSTTGAGLTGLAYNTASLTCYYRKGATGTPTALTLATQTVGGAHSDGGFVAVDGTNCPGQYRLDLSDTIVNTAGMTYVYLKGAANMAPCVIEVEVVSVNKFDAVRMGLTALPNAAADAAGGLPISDAGGLDLDARLDAAITSRLAPTTAGRTLDVSAGGEAGIDWANVGSPTTSLALTGTTIATTQKVDIETIKTNPVVNAGTVTFPTTATLASTTNITGGTITTVTNLTNAPTAGDLTATMKASINTEADTALTDYGALKPTTAGRTLDVTATGAAGIDFANVENQNATVTLSGTTIADVTAVGDNVDTLLARIPATLFSGITSLAQWLGLIAGKQTGNTTARTELRATGAGSGTFDETTDSVEALRDRGDAAWTTASGFATAAELAKVPKSDSTVTWNATALASINSEVAAALGTYDGPTNAEMVARTLAAASYATAAGVSAVETDTQDIQSRLPAALSGGRMAVDLQAIGNDTQSATDLKDFADTGYDPVTHRSSSNMTAINGSTGGVANIDDIGTNGWDNTLHRLNRVASTDSAEALGTQAKADVNAEVDAALGDYDGPTHAEMVDRTLLAAEYATAIVLAHVDSTADAIDLKTANLPSDPADQSLVEAAITAAQTAILAKLQGLVLEAATIGGTGNSTTAIHLPGLTYGDDEIISYLLVIHDVSEGEYHARWITDWVASTAVATVATLPFTPQDSTDTYWLLSARADVTGGSGPSAVDIRTEMDANSTKLANLDATVSSRATPAQVATELATYDGPTNAEFEARTIASASYATATALGTTDTRVQTLTTRVGIPAVSVSDDIAAVKTDTGNLVTRITSTLFSGITSMAQWLGLLAGKQVGDTTARTEIRATGAGSGTFDETTDSVQAIRDRGDAAWTTGIGGGGGEVTLADGAITAAKIADGAITGAKIADGSITSDKFTVASITGPASGILERITQLWRSRYKKTTTTGTTSSGERKEYADDGTTVIVTQAWTDNGTTSTQNTAT